MMADRVGTWTGITQIVIIVAERRVERMDGESESLKFWNLGKSIADGIEAGIKGDSE